MITHEYFGEIIQNEWNEFYLTKKINIPYFNQDVSVNLVEYDEDFEPIEEEPSKKILDEYADTLKKFLANIDSIIEDIQQETFDYYLRIYSKYYEKPFEVLWENQKIKKTENKELHEPLQIDTKEKHFEYISSILEKIIISNNQTIVIPFCYDIDEEHGLEIKIVKNKVVEVDGIGQTIYC